MAYAKATGLGGASIWSIDLDDFQGICGKQWQMLSIVSKVLKQEQRVPTEPCSEEGLFTDPDNCSGYLLCYKGTLRRGHCGIGRFFDSSQGRCVKANPQICNPGHSDRFTLYSSVHRPRVAEALEVLEVDARVVCYVTSWSLYRKGEGKFVPERLDSRLCTDVVYAFAGLNPETLSIQAFDPWADIENSK